MGAWRGQYRCPAVVDEPAAAPSSSDQVRACLLKLAPHLLGRARRGVVGSSRYAQRLREQIREAAADVTARPVLITGEPGLEKDNLAALIHFGSPALRQLLVRLDGATLQADGATLFGPPGSNGEDSLRECLGEGALLIDKLD
jgi:transcriptional regulator with AAA-type ATPase domain